MTAEIAIMNTQAVALAADSASTARVGDEKKIFPSANKLFSLSKCHPIGVMVYDNASFMRVPWETIIKIYRERIEERNFSTISTCVDDFVDFLSSFNKLLPPSIEGMVFREMVNSYFNYIKKLCLVNIKSFMAEKGEATPKEVECIVANTIEKVSDSFKDAAVVPSVTNDFNTSILSKYETVIDELIKGIFVKLPISEGYIDKLKEMSANLCCKFPKGLTSPFKSGVVVAGFGEEELFPALKSFEVEFILDGVLKYKIDKEKIIGEKLKSSIVAFAQRDVVATFMNGIDPDREGIERGFLEQLFKEYEDRVIKDLEGLDKDQEEDNRKKLKDISSEKLKEHWQKINALRQYKYVQPVMNVIGLLPKDELATVAETFVSLTSFKRRVSMQSETVGGPVDVAVISKGDGFVWIKRKRYFQQELNPQFLIK